MSRRATFGTALILLFIGVFVFSVQKTVTQSEAVLYVSPPTKQVSVNNDATINITVADIANLTAFQFYLGYNTTILDALTVTVYPPFEGYIRINETDGYVYVGRALPQGYPPLSGNILLASITFRAILQGNCTLHLYDTVLLDQASSPITHTTQDGSINVLEHPLIPGDVDDNGKVDLGDVVLLLDGFGSQREADGLYRHKPPCVYCPHSPNCDIDGDGKIAMGDIITALDHFGETTP